MNRTLFLLAFLFLTSAGIAQKHPAEFVWKDAEGSGRQQTVLFRRNIEIGDEGKGPAILHLFADSRYHLYVNGTHVNFGPSRFYVAHPEYDSYDLSPYLRSGQNVIAVEVLTNGTVTYQVPLSRGGFIAWGEITTASGSYSLSTPGEWNMWVSDAYDHQALRFSFACGPMEVFDGRKQQALWNKPGYDDSHWIKPVLMAEQAYWGELSPRTIPPLTQDEILPEQLLGIYRERRDEALYSFFIKTPDRENSDYNSGKQMYASTYIYSPVQQDVECGLWWGSYYLNGQGPVKISGKEPGNPVRENRILELKKGWNFLFVSYVAIWGAWDYYMALPGTAGLILSPHKKEGDPSFMFTSGPHPKNIGLFDPEKNNPGDDYTLLKNKDFQWKEQISLDPGPNPARDLVWRKPDLDHNLKKNDFQVTGFSTNEPIIMVFDMGRKSLGRLFCELDATEGAVVDVGWTEDLNAMDMPFLYKRLQVNSAARFIASEGLRRYETFKPYGVRYLLLRIDPRNGPGTLKKLGMVEQVYPYEKLGSFSCSNPMMDRIWELGWRTLRVCSEDSYTDTPFRERGLYAGDALPEYGISLATSGDSRLMKRSLLLFQDMYRDNLNKGSEEGLNDFVLKTLLELDWYYRITGDMDFLKSVYPNYRNLLGHLLDKKNDLGYYPSDRVFIEWTKIDKRADLTAYQALVARSFMIMSFLAGEQGYQEEAAQYRHESELLMKILNDLFWDPHLQVFRDGFKEGEAIDHHYPISSVYPMLFDLCNEVQKEAILKYLAAELKDIGEETRNRKITPYGSFYLFAALYKEGQAKLAEEFMIQYWSRMIHQGDDTSWENFDIGGESQGGQGTASHAWSGHPTFFLSSEILGVNLGFSHGFNRDLIEIQPQSESLSWARGTVPHPAGLVSVDWRIEGEGLIMNIVIPEGAEYEVQPRGRLAELDLDLNVKIQNSF